MTRRYARREAFYFHNQLTGIIKKLENVYTVIDLRNESSVTGMISYVDGFMNIELEDAILHDNRGDEHSFETFFIRARNIRYVHIPIDIPLIDLIKEIKEPVVRNKPKRGKTFKEKRAYIKQQQILTELAQTQQK